MSCNHDFGFFIYKASHSRILLVIPYANFEYFECIHLNLKTNRLCDLKLSSFYFKITAPLGHLKGIVWTMLGILGSCVCRYRGADKQTDR